MTILLRPVEPADMLFLLEVYHGTREDELALTDWDDVQKRAFVEQQFRAQDRYYRANYANATYQVILVDGLPAGRLYIARWPDEIRIMDIALLPGFRGRGIGTHLLEELRLEAVTAGKPLRIHVERFNPALSLYARLGFRMVEERGVNLFLEWPSDSRQSEPAAQPSSQPISQENPASA
jgi:ribosomal protein S18 acetylase RimI-like enzyme